MAENGVFAVARGIFDHPMFASDDPFTEREAWIWMIAEAAWKSTRIRAGVAVLNVARGEFAHSVRFLAKRWNWHPAKVQRFLARLKTDTMIETRVDTGVTVITICKYNEYQRVSLPNNTPSETGSDTAPIQHRYREEDREYKEEDYPSDNRRTKEASPKSELEAVLDAEHATAVVDHRKRLRKPLTPHAAKLLAGKLARCPDPNAAADVMIANGWQGFEPEWLNNRKGTGPPSNGSGSAPYRGDRRYFNEFGDRIDWDKRAERFKATGEWPDTWGSRNDIPPEYRDRFGEIVQTH